MAEHILFVYGTLKRGTRQHQLLAGQRFLGEAETLPLYRLYDAGPYPCLVEDSQHGRAIRGEIWAVDDAALPSLDAYEDLHLFERKALALADHPSPAIAYFYRGDVSAFRDCGTSWPVPR